MRRQAVLFATLATFAAPSAARASDDAAEFWLNPSVEVGLDDDTAFELETAQRFRSESDGRVDTYFFRGWVKQDIADNATLAGAVEYRINDGGSNEVRTIQQLSTRHGILKTRLRLEHLSSKRPLVRRTFNCAHELGHHVLGHGSSIDELRENQTVRPWDIPEEYSADTFAAYTLMPTLGLRNAFAVRGLKPETATPAEVYRIACQFGVGYSTLVTHLLWGEAMIGRSRADALRKFTPQSLRAQILGALTPQPLIVADEHWGGAAIDAEVGHLLLLPTGTVAHGNAVTAIGDLAHGRLFEAKRPGLVRLDRPGGDWAAFGRVARTAYVGLAEFRHLEDDEDD